MKRHLMACLNCWFLLGYAFSAQEKLPTTQVTQEISRLLNWRWFWEGQTGLKTYKPGKAVKVAIIESPNEVAAFISEIGIAAHFHFDGGRLFRESIEEIPDGSNDSAVNQYIKNYGVTPGFQFQQGKAPASPDVHMRRDHLTLGQKLEILKLRSTYLTLPILGPPNYISSHRAPPDLARFESVVRSRVGDFYSANCRQGEILIPYFSPSDPAVYVYADLGTCGEGIIGFVRDEKSQWTSGQFSPARPPNEWSTTIQRIRENTAVAIPLRAKAN